MLSILICLVVYAFPFETLVLLPVLKIGLLFCYKVVEILKIIFWIEVRCHIDGQQTHEQKLNIASY